MAKINCVKDGFSSSLESIFNFKIKDLFMNYEERKSKGESLANEGWKYQKVKRYE